MPQHPSAAPAAGDVQARLGRVRAEIAAAAREAGRPAEAVTLVAVSKTFPAEAAEAAIAAGQRVFGENRVQEAKAKWPDLRAAHDGLALHLIGPLQTNKVRDAVALFDVIETLDRPSLAEALAAERDRTGRCPVLLVEVNTGEEPQKAGVLPRDLPAFLELAQGKLGLPVAGLMCIPPVDENPAMHFALLAKLAARHGLARLSMGMSGDFPAAIRFGATQVRVGSAIFGERGTAAPHVEEDAP